MGPSPSGSSTDAKGDHTKPTEVVSPTSDAGQPDGPTVRRRGAPAGRYAGEMVRKGSSRPPDVPSWLWQRSSYKQRLAATARYEARKELESKIASGEVPSGHAQGSGDPVGEAEPLLDSVSAAPAEDLRLLASIWKRASALASKLGKPVDSILHRMNHALRTRKNGDQEQDDEIVPEDIPVMPTVVDGAAAARWETEFDFATGAAHAAPILDHREKLPDFDPAYSACVARPVYKLAFEMKPALASGQAT